MTAPERAAFYLPEGSNDHPHNNHSRRERVQFRVIENQNFVTPPSIQEALARSIENKTPRIFEPQKLTESPRTAFRIVRDESGEYTRFSNGDVAVARPSLMISELQHLHTLVEGTLARPLTIAACLVIAALGIASPPGMVAAGVLGYRLIHRLLAISAKSHYPDMIEKVIERPFEQVPFVGFALRSYRFLSRLPRDLFLQARWTYYSLRYNKDAARERAYLDRIYTSRLIREGTPSKAMREAEYMDTYNRDGFYHHIILQHMPESLDASVEKRDRDTAKHYARMVDEFEYYGRMISNKQKRNEVLSRIARARVALAGMAINDAPEKEVLARITHWAARKLKIISPLRKYNRAIDTMRLISERTERDSIREKIVNDICTKPAALVPKGVIKAARHIAKSIKDPVKRYEMLHKIDSKWPPRRRSKYQHDTIN